MREVSCLTNPPGAALSPVDTTLALVLPQLPSLSPPHAEAHLYGENGEKQFQWPKQGSKAPPRG